MRAQVATWTLACDDEQHPYTRTSPQLRRIVSFPDTLAVAAAADAAASAGVGISALVLVLVLLVLLVKVVWSSYR